MNFDAIVIGAGAMGSATAYYLAASGQKTLLLEQFALDHDRGSSYGESRIIRYAYDHPAYIALVRGAFPLWRALEEESGEKLLLKTGGLDFGKLSNAHFAATKRTLEETEIPFETLSPAETARRFPQFCLDEDMVALYQPDAGVLKASLCVRTHVTLAQRYGAQLIENAKVLNITPTAEAVTVETSQGTFSGARLVICAGSWTNTVLQPLGMNLPLQPTKEQNLFFTGNPPEDFSTDRCPIFINWGDPYHFYGIGSVDGTGFKCAQHGIHEPFDPDHGDRTLNADHIERVRGFLQRHIPRADGVPVGGRTCIYTMTPDEHFILDHHPEYAHIVFSSPCSGHGFKFSTLIGQILAEMVSGREVAYDLSLFRWDRF